MTTWKWVNVGSDDYNNQSGTHMELIQSKYEIGEADSILYHGADWPMDERHANLIAAAPDMLAALQDSLDTLEGIACFANGKIKDIVNDSIKQTRAAIAKAEGSE